MTDDFLFLTHALSLAKQAADLGEVPVGAVIVQDGRIVGQGYNRRELDKNPLAHAEIMAIRQASQTLRGWRLQHCTLYVTLEPCMMCTGAIINARIPRVVFGAKDPKGGCLGSILHSNEFKFNHKIQVEQNILNVECSHILTDFFTSLRQRKKGNHG